MPTPTDRYSLTDLADLAGVTTRTVRFYFSQGLLPASGATGPGVRYGEEHLDRLRLIRRLQREHLPLAEIRAQLAELDADQISKLASATSEDAHAARETNPPDSALDYVRRLLEPGQPRRPSLLRRVDAAPPVPPSLVSTLAPDADAAAPRPEPFIERSQWERIGLAPDIELHVRRPLSRPQSRKVDRLVSIARDLLEEDPS